MAEIKPDELQPGLPSISLLLYVNLWPVENQRRFNLKVLDSDIDLQVGGGSDPVCRQQEEEPTTAYRRSYVIQKAARKGSTSRSRTRPDPGQHQLHSGTEPNSSDPNGSDPNSSLLWQTEMFLVYRAGGPRF